MRFFLRRLARRRDDSTVGRCPFARSRFRHPPATISDRLLGRMRIVEVRLHWIRIRFHEPFRISSGEVSAKDAIVVELVAEDGARGWGEASPMAGAFYSAETPESTWKFLRERLVPRFLA